MDPFLDAVHLFAKLKKSLAAMREKHRDREPVYHEDELDFDTYDRFGCDPFDADMTPLDADFYDDL